MPQAIPTSASVWESAIIESPLAAVWHEIKLPNFASFWSQLSKSEFVKEASEDADITRWYFHDGTILEIKQEEHSVRSPFLGCGADFVLMNI